MQFSFRPDSIFNNPVDQRARLSQLDFKWKRKLLWKNMVDMKAHIMGCSISSNSILVREYTIEEHHETWSGPVFST